MDHSSVVGNSLHVGQPAAEWSGAVIVDTNSPSLLTRKNENDTKGYFAPSKSRWTKGLCQVVTPAVAAQIISLIINIGPRTWLLLKCCSLYVIG
ncbi:uncharacterized protein N7506_005364 [Penicillium brevicompactum]|uniref:uncharacterized protein n=1 Tax=Penicillium brevicompactum TaxID=5074 RepID=UPI002541B550|nr:uncharacterized protein N7506_005364 [Penicillium brevicompactum]KAJ5337342.1 hypothetical protein N7506_005364 [Penicillium brevicompactum]